MTSRQNVGVQESEANANSAFKYPPKTGKFTDKNRYVDDEN